MTTFEQFSSIPNGTRILNHGFDQCVALINHYHEDVIGGGFIACNSAHEWWTRNWAEIDRLYTKSSVPVQGAIFISLGGMYDRTHGHIGGIVAGVNANGTFNTLEQNAGTWRYVGRYTRSTQNVLGFLVPKNNPANPKLEPNQRVVGSNPVKRRSDATSASAEKQPPS